MNLVINKRRVQRPEINNMKDEFSGKIGFIATVTKVNSKKNTVDVLSCFGMTYYNIRVLSHEWVNNSDYFTGERNLPPVGAVVYVLCGSETVDNAIVLGSLYTLGDTKLRELMATDDSDKEEKAKTREKRTQGGWTETESYTSGIRVIKSQDEGIKIELVPNDDDQTGDKKKIKITLFDNVIEVNEDELRVTDRNNNVFNSTDGGIEITDKNNNKIKLSDSGMDLTDKNNNTVKTDSTGVHINGTNLEIS